MSDSKRPTFLRRWFRDDSLKRVFQNGLVLFKGKAMAGIVGLGYLSLGAHALGPEQFGILIIVNVYALTVGELFGFSGWHTVIRYGAECLEAGRTEDLQKLVGFATAVEFASALAGVVFAVAFVPIVAPYLGIPDEVIPTAALYGLASLSIARSTPSAVLYLFERFNTLSMQQPLNAILRLIAAGLAWLSGAGLEGFLIAWMLAHVADAVCHWAFALRELQARGLLRGVMRWPSGVTKRHAALWRFSVTTKLDKSVAQLGARVAPLAVGFVLEPAAVALYHVALRVGMMLGSPTLVLGRTVYPELAGLAASSGLRSILRVSLRSGAVAGAGVIPAFLIFVFFGSYICELIGGEGFGAAHATLIMIAFGQVIQLLGFPLGSALTAIGRPGDALRVNAVVTVGGVPVLFGLLYGLGLAGAGAHAILLSIGKVGGLMAGLWGAREEQIRA